MLKTCWEILVFHLLMRLLERRLAKLTQSEKTGSATMSRSLRNSDVLLSLKCMLSIKACEKGAISSTLRSMNNSNNSNNSISNLQYQPRRPTTSFVKRTFSTSGCSSCKQSTNV